ncbi:MAG: CYTH domain-containing protein [Sideroxydans sp.]|nr:CYTH domain-containing protein [Sideroxydans sp.]
MAIETELKLRIAPEHLARLRVHSFWHAHAASAPRTRQLFNQYFDTPDLALHHAAMALRLRRNGEQWLQTLKGGGAIEAGLHQRNEWEVAVAGAALDFSTHAEVDWDSLLPQTLREKLQPVFVTDFMRSSFMLGFAGAQIEVCMDEGWIHTEARRHAICEVELELKSGSTQALFELALALLDIVPLSIEVVNKAEYGFRLLDENFVESACVCARPKWDVQQDLAAQLQNLMWACLLHLQKNLRGIHGSASPAFRAQVELALRRLKLLLRVIIKLSDNSVWCELKTQLVHLSGDALDELALQRVMLKIAHILSATPSLSLIKNQKLPRALRAYFV